MNTQTQIEIRETKYYGVWLEHHNGLWFITTDDGCEDCVGESQPTDIEIDLYVQQFAN